MKVYATLTVADEADIGELVAYMAAHRAVKEVAAEAVDPAGKADFSYVDPVQEDSGAGAS